MQAGLTEPEFDTRFGGLQIEFYPKSKTVEETVEETIIKLIKFNPKTTTKVIIASTGLSRRGVGYHLSKLKEKGRIDRMGSTKGGSRMVLE